MHAFNFSIEESIEMDNLGPKIENCTGPIKMGKSGPGYTFGFSLLVHKSHEEPCIEFSSVLTKKTK